LRRTAWAKRKRLDKSFDLLRINIAEATGTCYTTERSLFWAIYEVCVIIIRKNISRNRAFRYFLQDRKNIKNSFAEEMVRIIAPYRRNWRGI